MGLAQQKQSSITAASLIEWGVSSGAILLCALAWAGVLYGLALLAAKVFGLHLGADPSLGGPDPF